MAYRLYRHLTHIVWFLVWPWRAVMATAGADEWRQRFGELPRVPSGALWLHAASVGEVSGAAPLVRALAESGAAVLVTVVTRTGLSVAERELAGEAIVAHAPLDFPRSVRTALDRVRPRALLLVETEIWPNLVVEAAAAGAFVGVVNGRLTERGLLGSLRRGSPVRRAARCLSAVFCQTEGDRERFVRLGVPAGDIEVLGSMKFDALADPPTSEERERLRSDLGLPPSSASVVFGSVRPDEEQAVVASIEKIAASAPSSSFVLAPRHLDRVKAIAGSLERRGVSFVLRSDGRPVEAGGVLLLDTTGELSRVYAAADVAFVGGTLAPYGGHNPLEPAAAAVPVIIGPHTESCADAARLLVERGAAFVVSTADGLAATVLELLLDKARRRGAGRRGLDAVRDGRGAAARTAAAVLERVGTRPAARGPRTRGGAA